MDKLWNQKELAALMGVSETSLWRWTKERLLPRPQVRGVRRRYYDRAQMEEVVRLTTELRKAGRIASRPVATPREILIPEEASC